ncbi:hypothetical protein KP509_08G034700 [Ceratopteris richardii]|uniref:Uncharacterized protein n=1 Tax=Ceratopteris richardii TaxID=49495 RepID=A0A8T2U4S0_CERRI|nr:hypothetical protein KP509_08G034700 [Ceratopteris richardii]
MSWLLDSQPSECSRGMSPTSSITAHSEHLTLASRLCTVTRQRKAKSFKSSLKGQMISNAWILHASLSFSSMFFKERSTRGVEAKGLERQSRKVDR